MAMSLGEMHAALVKAGLPVEGLSDAGGKISVHYVAETTAAQKQQIDLMIKEFSNKSRRPKSIKDASTGFAALSKTDQAKVLERVVAVVLLQNPGILNELDVKLDVDEIVTDV